VTLFANAFTVIKNVNTGNPPIEKIVIFDKARGAANKVVLVANDGAIALNADGAIQIDIIGNAKASPEINWKPDGALGETFDATQYNFLMLTCHMEGKTVQTDPISGKTRELPAKGNMYYAAVLRDKDGQGVGYANLADVSEDGNTPLTVVTLPMPMVLFYKGSPNDIHHIKGIAFPWGTTHPDMSRDLHIIIDKIALAE
jgi:hypothetical protein